MTRQEYERRQATAESFAQLFKDEPTVLLAARIGRYGKEVHPAFYYVIEDGSKKEYVLAHFGCTCTGTNNGAAFRKSQLVKAKPTCKNNHMPQGDDPVAPSTTPTGDSTMTAKKAAAKKTAAKATKTTPKQETKDMTAQAPQTADPADEIAILQAKLKEARERKAAAEAEAKEQRKAEAAQRRERKVAEYEDKAREHLRRMVAALVAAGYENEVAIEGFVAQRALDLLTQEQAAAEDRKARHIEHSKASAARRKAAK